MNASHPRAVGLSLFTGETVSRYASRNLLGSILGPSAEFVGDSGQVMRALLTGEVAASDVHAFRKLIPTQNVMLISKWFDQMEQNVNAAFGIPVRRKQ